MSVSDDTLQAYIRRQEGVRSRRRAESLSQTQLARRLGSSQSRVAKMEAADPSVSIDLMVRALYGLGASNQEVARLIRNGAGRTTTRLAPSRTRHSVSHGS